MVIVGMKKTNKCLKTTLNNCRICSDVVNKECSICLNNFYKDENGVCIIQGIDNCKSYNYGNKCLNCQSNYYHHFSNCKPCSSNRKICEYDSITKTSICNECNSNYGLINRKCYKCRHNKCENCDGDVKVCRHCQEGFHKKEDYFYFWDKWDNTCQLCNDSDNVCEYLQNGCYARYYEVNCDKFDESGKRIKCHNDDIILYGNKCYSRILL
ncbi:CXXC-rich protein [Entamoeba marina]